VLILSGSCSFEFFLALLYHFAWICRFLCLLLAFAVFLLLDDLLELFWLFGYSSCAFVVNGLIKGEIEKPSGQFLDLIVMSH
jgi:hypothetical protein